MQRKFRGHIQKYDPRFFCKGPRYVTCFSLFASVFLFLGSRSSRALCIFILPIFVCPIAEPMTFSWIFFFGSLFQYSFFFSLCNTHPPTLFLDIYRSLLNLWSVFMPENSALCSFRTLASTITGSFKKLLQNTGHPALWEVEYMCSSVCSTYGDWSRGSDLMVECFEFEFPSPSPSLFSPFFPLKCL